MDTKALGAQGESIAAAYLEAHGCRIIARNFRALMGEIDLIAEECDTIIFVEVKTRRSMRFGTPAQAVHVRKQRKIILTAYSYIQQEHLEGRLCRFDVIEVYARGNSWPVHHLKNAFEVHG
jgi:putative endonuclease